MLITTLARFAELNPERPVLSDGKQRMTAGQLLAAVERQVASLRANNIQQLAIYADNSIAWVVLDLACQSNGVTVLPLPLFFSSTQIRHALQASGISTVLVDAGSAATPFQFLGKRAEVLDSNWDLYRWQGAESAAGPRLPGATQKITFTSGSTGNPKGVCLSVAQQLRVAEALAGAVTAMPVTHLCLLPLSTLLENIGGVYAPLLGGGAVIVPSLAAVGLSGSSGIDSKLLLAVIARLQPSSIILLPQMLTLLVAAVAAGWKAPASLEFIAVGGGMVAEKLIIRARQLGLPVNQGYGLSECASVVCLNSDSNRYPASVGKPLNHVGVRLDDGEIVVSGNVCLGYVNEPDSWYQEAFYTGDLGAIDADGNLYIRGRRKNIQVSSFGRNLNPEWVESEILTSPLIDQASVYTEAKPYCVALIHVSNEAVGDHQIQQVLDAMNARLPDYARVKRWHRLTEKPSVARGLLTENGRLKRAAIYQVYAPILKHLYANDPETQANVLL